MATFAKAVPVGLFDSEQCRINTEVPSVTIGEGAIGADSTSRPRVLRVEWNRNTEFSRAVLRWDSLRFGSSPVDSGVETEADVVIKLRGETIFKGIVGNFNHRLQDPNSENVEAICVDAKWHLFKDSIFGQRSIQVIDDEEAGSFGLPGGLGFMTGLTTLFNPKEGIKTDRDGEEPELDPTEKRGLGNRELEPVFVGSTKYHLFREDGVAWSASDMVEYIFQFCKDHPLEIISAIFDPDKIELGDTSPLVADFPYQVNAQGKNCLAAINEVTRRISASFWYNPFTNMLEFWTPGHKLGTAKLWLKSVPDGLVGGDVSSISIGGSSSSGLGGVVDGVTLNDIIVDEWTINNADMTFNHTGRIRSLIGVTERQRIQNVFSLRKGWSDEIHEKVITFVPGSGTKKEDDGSYTLEATIEEKEGQGFTIKKIQGGYSIRIHTKPESEVIDFGAKWITDETGELDDLVGADRDPYNYVNFGLTSVNGFTYAVRRRPFLPKNIQKDAAGEQIPLTTAFSQFHPNQKSREKDTDTPNVDNRRIVGYETFGTDSDGKGEVKKFPFIGKSGRVEILKRIGGIHLRGGNLHWWAFSYDPGTDGDPDAAVPVPARAASFKAFPPLVLATVLHDQGKVQLSPGPLTIPAAGFAVLPGASLFPRRFFDGQSYKFRKVLAGLATQALMENAHNKIHGGGGATEDEEGLDTASLPAPIDESPNMKKAMDEIRERLEKVRIAGTFVIPAIVLDFKLGMQITALVDRVPVLIGVVVSVALNFESFNTEITVESEQFRARGL